MTDIAGDGTSASGRRPKSEKAVHGNLFDMGLTQKLEEKIQGLEAKIAGLCKVEKELRQSEDGYRLLFETMTQGVMSIDIDGRIISANNAVARIWGLPVEEFTGMTVSDPRWKAIYEDGADYEVDSLPVPEALRSGKPVREQLLGIFNFAEETYHWVLCNAIPMFRSGEDGPYQVCATFDDITGRHLAHRALKESESRTMATLENAVDAIWSFDSDFRLIAANGAAHRLHNLVNGATLVEGVDVRSAMPKEHYDLWTAAGRRVFTGECISFEKRYELAGAPIDLEFSLSPIVSPAGRITGASNFARDITERKKVAFKLTRSEELFRMAVQSTTDVVWDWDIASGHIDWYGDIDGLLGYPRGEFPRRIEAWENALHRDDHDRVMAALNRHAGNGDTYNIEYRITRKDGPLRNWIGRGLVIRDEEGRILRSVGACVDITEYRRSEARVRVRRDLAVKLADRMDMETALKHCLDAAIEISGFDTGVIYILDEKSGDFKAACTYGGSSFLLDHYSVLQADSVDARFLKKGAPLYITSAEFTPPFDAQLRPEGFTFDATIPVLYEDRVIASLGIFSHIQDNMPAIIRDSLEAIAADIGVIIDRLTSRQALQASEERYRFITNHTADVIWVLDKKLRYTFISPSVTRLRGFTVEEAMGHDVTRHITPASIDALTKAIESGGIPALGEAAGRDQWFTMELEMYRKDGSTVWMETSMTVIKDEEGGFKGLLGISRDITARRQADKDILQRATLLDAAYDSIIAYDPDGKIIYANQAACDIRGFSRDEMLAMNMRQLVPADKLPGLEERHRQLLEQGELSSEAVHIRKDGSAFIVDTHLRLAQQGGEKLVIAVQRDITLRKQMENQLVESEAKYRTVVENMHDVLYRTDNKGDIVLASPSITRLLGVESVAQVIGKNLAMDLYANPQDRVRTLELLNANGEIVDHEVVLRRPDGKLITVAANSHVYRDAGGRPAGVEGVIRDITGRKKAEAELLAALDRLGSSLESTIDAIAMMSELRDPYTAGHQRRVTQLALAIAAELGLPDDRMQPLRVAGLLHDVGKIFVPSEILSKPGRLTALEMELVRAHVTAGYDIIAAIKFPWPIADMVIQHHERMDGSGYPAGLKGDEITLEARILAVADVTEAMMSHRPYRPSLGMDKALAEITANRGMLYDEKAGDACVKLLTEKGFVFPD
jgi:PAS domain S-box-containing protein/putative nucleotidyltransferase with HDIG domain